MLTQIYHRHNQARLLAFYAVTTVAPSASLEIGAMDATVVRAGIGQPTISPRLAYSRRACVVATPSNDTGTASYACLNTSATSSSFPIQALNSAAGGVDSGVDVVALGWDSANEDETGMQPLVSSLQTPRVIAARIDGTTGAVLQGAKDITVVKASTGVYNITYNGAFGVVPVVAASAEGGNYRAMTWSSKLPGSCTIRSYNLAAAATDCIFHFVAVGQMGRDVYGKMRNPIMSSTQLVPVGLSLDASETAMLVGTSDVSSVTKGATGDFTINFKKPFGKIPVCVATSISQRRAWIIAATTTSVRVGMITNGGSSVDVDTDILVFGSTERGE